MKNIENVISSLELVLTNIKFFFKFTPNIIYKK